MWGEASMSLEMASDFPIIIGTEAVEDKGEPRKGQSTRSGTDSQGKISLNNRNGIQMFRMRMVKYRKFTLGLSTFFPDLDDNLPIMAGHSCGDVSLVE